ncbi:hypothetical protein ABPG75_000096 [Micractinium tetrahymenae]
MASLAARGVGASVALRPCSLFGPLANVPWRSQFASKQQQSALAGGRALAPPVAAAARGGDPRGFVRSDVKAPTRVMESSLQDLICLSDNAPAEIELAMRLNDGGYYWTEADASTMLGHLLTTMPAWWRVKDTHAVQLQACSLGHMLVAPCRPAADGLRKEKVAIEILDGQRRILTLCLLLAAARERFLAADDSKCLASAKQIKQMLVQKGDIMKGVKEQLRIRLLRDSDTAFLHRQLLDPACPPGDHELSGETRRNLHANMQLFRRKLSGMELRQVQLLAEVALRHATATFHGVTSRDDVEEYTKVGRYCHHLHGMHGCRARRVRTSLPHYLVPSAGNIKPLTCLVSTPSVVQAHVVPAKLLSFWLPQERLPIELHDLAYSADITISLAGSDLPIGLHSQMLRGTSGVLSRAVLANDGDSAAQAAAVEQAFEGHPTAEVKLFLRLLYGNPVAGLIVGDPAAGPGSALRFVDLGWVPAKSVADPEALGDVARLAYKLEAATVLQVCDFRLCELLGKSMGINWASWQLVADSCGLILLRALAKKNSAKTASE